MDCPQGTVGRPAADTDRAVAHATSARAATINPAESRIIGKSYTATGLHVRRGTFPNTGAGEGLLRERDILTGVLIAAGDRVISLSVVRSCGVSNFPAWMMPRQLSASSGTSIVTRDPTVPFRR